MTSIRHAFSANKDNVKSDSTVTVWGCSLTEEVSIAPGDYLVLSVKADGVFVEGVDVLIPFSKIVHVK